MTKPKEHTRRDFAQVCTVVGGTLVLGTLGTGCAHRDAAPPALRALSSARGRIIDLKIAETRLLVGGREGLATTINGGIPGPELLLQEGEQVTIRVHNGLKVDTSLHWHGLLVPTDMDGVPGLSFAGIKPGETFEYRFTPTHSGTYWYHSHSGFQEQTGTYGSIVVRPREREIHQYDRDYTVVLSDWTFENPHRVLANLKRYGGYYNFQRRSLANLGAEMKTLGLWGALGDRTRWARMRMDSTDLADVTGATYTYLMNGLSADENWVAKFSPGERVRLRFVNAAAATTFDIRIPGLDMTVIQADGMNVVPVEVHEFRVANAETYDVIIAPTKTAYTIFAETMDRSGFVRGTVATAMNGSAEVPRRRQRALLTMDDMGMDHSQMKGMEGGSMKGMDHSKMKMPVSAPSADDSMKGMDHSKMKMPGSSAMNPPAPSQPTCRSQTDVVSRHEKVRHGPGNSMVAAVARSRVKEPGVGLRDATWKVLTYSDLKRANTKAPASAPTREIELHLTGNMERYMWSFDGVQFGRDTPPIKLRLGERVRFVLINDTMMSHPIHIHGMFFELEVGGCETNPLKHTVNVQPAERVSFVVEPTEVGRWAFHCHIIYHMDAGMFRVVEVVA